MDNGEYKQKDAAGAHDRKSAEGAAQSVTSDVDASVQSVDLEAEMMKDFDAYFRASKQPSELTQNQSGALEDDVLAEMARYDVPNPDMGHSAYSSAIGDGQLNATPLSESTGQSDYSDLQQTGGDLLIDDLERELAHLQRGLTLPVLDEAVQDQSKLVEKTSVSSQPSPSHAADAAQNEANSDSFESSSASVEAQPEFDVPVSQEVDFDQLGRLFGNSATVVSEGNEAVSNGVVSDVDGPGLEVEPASEADIFNPPSHHSPIDLENGYEPMMPLTPQATTDNVVPAAEAIPTMPAAAQFDVNIVQSDAGSSGPLGERGLPVDADSVDMSKLVEPSDDVEEITPFDIPDIEVPVDVHSADRQADLGLDLELEREFTELLSEKSVPQADIATPDAPAVPLGSIQNAADLDVALELKNYFAGKENNANLLPELAAASVAQGRPAKINLADTPINEVAQALKEQATSERNKSRTPIIAVLALIALSGGGFLFWQSFSSDFRTIEQPIIISADSEAIKQVPANPGGTLVPNQDQAVYDQVEGNDVTVASQSSLVENREEPIDIVQQTLNPDILPSNVAPASETRLSPSDPSVIGGDQSADPAQPLVMPKKVRTVIVQSDGTIITREIEQSTDNNGSSSLDVPATSDGQITEAPSTQNQAVSVDVLRSTIAAQSASNDGAVGLDNELNATNSESAASGSAPAPEQDTSAQVAEAINQAAQQITENALRAATVPTPSINPASVAGSGNQSDQPSNAPTDLLTAANSAPTASAAPVATQVVSNPPQTSSFDGYYMQIASQPSRAAAEATYADLTGQFNTLLNGFNVVYQEAVIEGRGTFHRVRLEIGTRSDAVTLCERFKAAGGSCFVTR